MSPSYTNGKSFKPFYPLMPNMRWELAMQQKVRIILSIGIDDWHFQTTFKITVMWNYYRKVYDLGYQAQHEDHDFEQSCKVPPPILSCIFGITYKKAIFEIPHLPLITAQKLECQLSWPILGTCVLGLD